jgi:hypothetical protein
MWWWLQKISESDDLAIYGYGIGTQTVTGEISINKKDNSIVQLKPADDDNQTYFMMLRRYVMSIIILGGFPDVRSIATG